MRIPVERSYSMLSEMVVKWKKKPICILKLLILTASVTRTIHTTFIIKWKISAEFFKCYF